MVGGCPDTPIALDASDYSGGGIRPLTFEWMAHPSKCDNYYAISAQLEAQRDHEEIALLTSEGSSYLFMLTATNFLGRKSPVLYKSVNRTSLPIPTVTVLAPALTEIRLRRGASDALRYQTLEVRVRIRVRVRVRARARARARVRVNPRLSRAPHSAARALCQPSSVTSRRSRPCSRADTRSG